MPVFVRLRTQFYILLNIPKLSIVLILNTQIQDLTEVRDLSLENWVYFRSSATKGHENNKIDKYGHVMVFRICLNTRYQEEEQRIENFESKIRDIL